MEEREEWLVQFLLIQCWIRSMELGLGSLFVIIMRLRFLFIDLWEYIWEEFIFVLWAKEGDIDYMHLIKSYLPTTITHTTNNKRFTKKDIFLPSPMVVTGEMLLEKLQKMLLPPLFDF